jgi:predicted deacylase
MLQREGDGMWWLDSGRPGPTVGISFGVHGDERAPVEAGLAWVEGGGPALTAGRLLLLCGNPRAVEANRRWSEGGIDLNRCFHPTVLARAPALYEEERAREIAAVLERRRVEILVDFHCTVEPGRRFLMQHPPLEHAPSREVAELLAAETLLADPRLEFGGVSLDEWMTTRGRVGICYETGWLSDPANTPASVAAEMSNLLSGLGLTRAPAPRTFPGKRGLELDAVLPCEAPGFAWNAGIGENLQSLPRGTELGAYAGGRKVVLERDAVLVFPKKKPELVALGKPLVYLASPR